MYTTIDLNSWKRKEHFEFFRRFNDPFWGITTEVECTGLYNRCKREKGSFFLYNLHAILQAVNQVEEFRYRIVGDQVAIYDLIGASPTIGREDETFGFGLFEYRESLDEFIAIAKLEIEKVRNSTGTQISDKTNRIDMIHFSTLPWFGFSDMKHACSHNTSDSCPKIQTGKIREESGRILLPLSVTVHHGLIDGLHIAKFLEALKATFSR